MTNTKKRQQDKKQKEFGLFTLVGFIATVIDYAILNILANILGWPLVAANIVSASTSSTLSYVLNRKVVFEGKAHSEKTTFLLYAGTVVVSILVIQSGILYLLDNGLMQDIVKNLGAPSGSVDVIAANASKIVAGFGSLVWNFMTQRRFVFTSVDKSKN